jgi:hypothetical protein
MILLVEFCFTAISQIRQPAIKMPANLRARR